MATSSPDPIPTTPPPAPPKGRTRKASEKVLEAQQSLRTRTTTLRTVQTGHGATGSQPEEAEEPSIVVQTPRDVLPSFPTSRVSGLPERAGSSIRIEEIAELLVSLKETIAQQSSIIASQNGIIESVKSDLAAIKTEQQYLKSQNAELQETIASLRAQLDTISVSPPSTQTWASVAASGG